MKYLLDTHALLWILSGDDRIPEKIRNILLDTDNQIYYSSISTWEVELKHQKYNSFKLSGSQLCHLCNLHDVLNITVTNKHISKLTSLPTCESVNHKDPFDRMLLAQAISENMILITHDQKFSSYNISNLMLF